jgi:hypothetical protein
MITISKRVEQLIERWPMLKQGLELDLLNTSAVARYLKPEVEREVGERVSEAAVLMALRRYQIADSGISSHLPQDYLGDISLRTDLVDLTYTNSPTLPRKLARIAHELAPQHYFTSSRGLLQTSVIVHGEHIDKVSGYLIDETLEKTSKDLTAITLHLKPGHDEVAGILVYPLSILSWRGITVVEVISTFDELNLIIHASDVESAFSALNQAIS